MTPRTSNLLTKQIHEMVRRIVKRCEVLAVVQQWVQKAENDLKTATYTLQLKEECPTDTVCFHAQQCIEKYLKAVLVYNGVDFPRTHNLSVLIVLLPQPSCLSLTT